MFPPGRGSAPSCPSTSARITSCFGESWDWLSSGRSNAVARGVSVSPAFDPEGLFDRVDQQRNRRLRTDASPQHGVELERVPGSEAFERAECSIGEVVSNGDLWK